RQKKPLYPARNIDRSPITQRTTENPPKTLEHPTLPCGAPPESCIAGYRIAAIRMTTPERGRFSPYFDY
ncbi:MAG: hypothetical protein ACKOAX_01845, partial [Candidatus Kapaibacterium sp.]